MTKKEWNWYSWAGDNHQVNVGLQIERGPYTCKTLAIIGLMLGCK